VIVFVVVVARRTTTGLGWGEDKHQRMMMLEFFAQQQQQLQSRPNRRRSRDSMAKGKAVAEEGERGENGTRKKVVMGWSKKEVRRSGKGKKYGRRRSDPAKV
jgi:hypothetical protein